MKNFAPKICRQRMVIEGIYSAELNPAKLKNFMHGLSKKLRMTILFGPIVKNLAGKFNPKHKGYECILIWASSGASVYTWEYHNFFTVDIYTCRKFDHKKALAYVKDFFKAEKIAYKNI
jgi:S-adenosylmethionine/arginine decarboxylase-like enzyme